MAMGTLQLDDRAPAFNLPSVDGRTYSLETFADRPVLVVIFSCNHCPYVQAYEDRMVAIQRDYRDRGVQFVAINSNDDRNYPEDSFERMGARAKAKGFNFPPPILPTSSSLTVSAASVTRGRSTTTGRTRRPCRAII